MVGRFAMLALSAALLGCAHPPEQKQSSNAITLDSKLWAARSGASFDVDFGAGAAVQFEQTVTEGMAQSDERVITLTREDHSLVERYLVSPEGIALVGLGQDRFTPPIPLVRYGGQTGEKTTWSGVNETPGVPPLTGEAEVVLAEEVLRLKAGTFTTLRVQVSLRLGGAANSEELGFWFCPGEGLVQAKLGGYTRALTPSQ